MTKITASLSELPRLYFLFKNVEIGQVIRRLLEPDFMITTKSGEEPLNQNTLGDYDLIVMDGDMDLLKTLRANPAITDLPILVMSGPCEAGLQVQALDMGANDIAVMPLAGD